MSESAREDTPEQAEFRQYCREWLQANKPGEPPVRLPLSPLETPRMKMRAKPGASCW